MTTGQQACSVIMDRCDSLACSSDALADYQHSWAACLRDQGCDADGAAATAECSAQAESLHADCLEAAASCSVAERAACDGQLQLDLTACAMG